MKRVDMFGHGENSYYDKEFLASLINAPVSNRNRLKIALRALLRAIDQELTPRQREIIQLIYFDGNSGDETASILGLSPSSVSRTKGRAERRLKKAMQFYMDYLNCNLNDDDD